jgi:hypothetical protein
MSAMQMRYFNQDGIAEFERYLDQLEKVGAFQPAHDLLENPSLTVPMGCTHTIGTADFTDRFTCGNYFSNKIHECSSDLKRSGINPVGHRGLWTWFAAASIELLLKDSKGNFFVGAHERYVLSTSARRDYRHLLYGPWLVLNAAVQTPDLVRIALKDPVTKDSPVFEQLASRKEIISNPNALALVNKFYRKVGSNDVHPMSVKDDIAGGLRRFGAVYSQLAVNFDLHNMSEQQIEKLLPKEFERWATGSPPSPVAKKVRRAQKQKTGRQRKPRKSSKP